MRIECVLGLEPPKPLHDLPAPDWVSSIHVLPHQYVPSLFAVSLSSLEDVLPQYDILLRFSVPKRLRGQVGLTDVRCSLLYTAPKLSNYTGIIVLLFQFDRHHLQWRSCCVGQTRKETAGKRA